MFCRYCMKFHLSELRENLRNSQGKLIHQTRYCPSADDMKQSKDPSCEHFSSVTTFWCDNNDQWLDLVVCRAKQRKECPECKKCNQKHIVNELTKPVLKKRTDKPILMKRRKI